ncbi:IS21-like element helper ATPase IstB [Ferruginibacter sp.]|uniref:IS21-like element helper ATPase IstB n=1 Tax=Ferruginibacter sp. TaxID=1940288 RepID=UPI002658CD1C|nr:IS21-like element helper ATPase IstB [Ferruginibacter sp.]
MNKDSLEKMSHMRLLGMHQAYKASLEADQSQQCFTNDELVQHLVQSEWDDRKHRSVQRGLKNANFRYSASIEQLDYSGDRGLDKNIVQRLSTCDFIKKGEDLFITGSTGTGKSFLASALGQQACLMGYKILYTNTAKLMSHLKMAKADGAHLKELSKIEKQDALILDDFGVHPFDAGSRALLLDIIEDRHGKRSTIITAQVPVKKWHEVIGEKTLADAILDRIVHQSIRIELYGESLRKKQKGKPETMQSYL